jgi:hypothetical protein
MRHHDTIFDADFGINAKAIVFPPAEFAGFVSIRIHAANEKDYMSPLTIRLPFEMADKAKRIAAAINEIMAEDAAPVTVAQAAE